MAAMGEDINYPAAKIVTAIVTTGTAHGLSLADAAAIATLVAGVLASIISSVVLGELAWKRILKPILIWRKWFGHGRRIYSRDGDKV